MANDLAKKKRTTFDDFILRLGSRISNYTQVADIINPPGPTHEVSDVHGVTTFTLEAHVTYQRELREGASLRFTTQLLGFDAKRIHYTHEMYHAAEGFLASTNELISIHVSQETRRITRTEPITIIGHRRPQNWTNGKINSGS